MAASLPAPPGLSRTSAQRSPRRGRPPAGPWQTWRGRLASTMRS